MAYVKDSGMEDWHACGSATGKLSSFYRKLYRETPALKCTADACESVAKGCKRAAKALNASGYRIALAAIPTGAAMAASG